VEENIIHGPWTLEEGDTVFKTTVNQSPSNTASHPRQPVTSITLLRKPQKLTKNLLFTFICTNSTWQWIINMGHQESHFRLKHYWTIISSTNFNAQFSLFINNMFVILLSSTCLRALNQCAVQTFTESEDTRCCVNTIFPPEDGHVNARNMSGIIV